MTEFMRMQGIYWTTTCLDLLGRLNVFESRKNEIVEFVKSCRCDNGGYSPAPLHDPHILSTLSAVQVLAVFDAMSEIDVDAVVGYVATLAKEDGSYAGDEWDEVDTRFTFCAVATLALLRRLDCVNKNKVAEYLKLCMNFDGGFGTRPHSETHSGQIYCCLGTLAIIQRLDIVDADKLGRWLAERQLPAGGLNGRPEKLPDVCYSWWVLSSLTMLGRTHWIDTSRLVSYIMQCQETEKGGIADRPGHLGDPFHTLFGVTGLSLIQHFNDQSHPDSKEHSAVDVYDLKAVNPVFCLPQHVLDRLGVKAELLPERSKQHPEQN